jgi:thioredoxin reductase/Fe-S-cluster-containing hydrogenase component 2
MMKRYEVIVIGAGPAGLSAAIEAATEGMDVVVFDENDRPGGQLFKQIHKFFGSKEHRAKERGFRIGEDLLKEAGRLGVEVKLNTTVMGIFGNKEVSVMKDGGIEHVRGNDIVIATGASENAFAFPGWTLPGVMGAGAAQTMMNIHGVRPGNKVLMIGSGNVGVVVGYQLIQAGCHLVGVVDAAPRISGYGVHAAKIARTGVPFYLSHTVKEALGQDQVQGAVIAQVDNDWQIIAGTEKTIEVDTICLAVGLSPMSQLARMAGCNMEEVSYKGGLVPICNDYRETSIPGIYVAGDVAGIEEASSAMIQGKIAGAAICRSQGYIDESTFLQKFKTYHQSLIEIHQGMFGPEQKGRIDVTETEEGCPLCENLLTKGYQADVGLQFFPGIPTPERRKRGVVAVIECSQNIPCDPCQDACPKGCITVPGTIAHLPVFQEVEPCTGCGLCVSACPGQAVFLVDETYGPGEAAITIPYEMVPAPEVGSKGMALDRSGSVLGEAEIIQVRKTKGMDKTALITMKVPEEWSMKARYFRAM